MSPNSEINPATPGLTIRPAVPADAETILQLVRGLADYERLPPPDSAAQGRLIRDMFSTPPRIQAFLGEYQGIAAGYAFVFETYSSFLAFPTLYLEDLFVDPARRAKGAGRALIAATYVEADKRGCTRTYWSTQESNYRARGLYDQVATKSPFVQYRR